MSVFSILRGRSPQPISINGPWPDDLEIMKLGKRKEDVFTLRNAKQSVCIFGENGSGKTSGSGHLLARKYLEAGFGGLVLCFKTEEPELWRSYLKAAGREADGKFFSESGPYRFNFLEYEAKRSGVRMTENLVSLLVDVASIKRRESGMSNQAYWTDQKRKLIRNAISLCQMSSEPIQLRTLYKLIVDAPISLDHIKNDEWKAKSTLYALLSKASYAAGKTAEYALVKDYWMRERPPMSEKTRGTIDSDFTGMFDPLTRGEIGDLFGTYTTIDPDDILDGKVLVIDLPVAEYNEIGQYAALIWAQLFQRAVDRRTYSVPKDRPVFLWEDEAHHFTIEQDAIFQTTARSKGICTVRLTQNIPNYLDAYGPNGKHKVNTLLGNHVLKIFHRNGDPETNEWAARVIGKEFKVRHSLSVSGTTNDDAKMSASAKEEYEDSCPPHKFKRLKNGGPENDNEVEAIIYQTGREWANGKEWTKITFRQTS